MIPEKVDAIVRKRQRLEAARNNDTNNSDAVAESPSTIATAASLSPAGENLSSASPTATSTAAKVATSAAASPAAAGAATSPIAAVLSSAVSRENQRLQGG